MWEAVRPYPSASATKTAVNPATPKPPKSDYPTPPASAPAPPEPPAPPQPDATTAVQQCCAAYYQALAAKRAARASDSAARDHAKDAYRASMPLLTSRAGIRDFIACVGQGMILGVFWNDEGPRLAAVARIALAALPPEPKPAGRPKKPAENC